jgi:hypothetical protein
MEQRAAIQQTRPGVNYITFFKQPPQGPLVALSGATTVAVSTHPQKRIPALTLHQLMALSIFNFDQYKIVRKYGRLLTLLSHHNTYAVTNITKPAGRDEMRRFSTVSFFVEFYRVFFFKNFCGAHYWLKQLRRVPRAFIDLKLYFRRKSLFVLIHDRHNRTYASFSTGFFIKFFKKKKTLKKHKLLRVLVGRYLRKLFILAAVKNLRVTIQGVPLYLLEILNSMNRPSTHVFYDPVTEKNISDTAKTGCITARAVYFFFIKNVPFVIQRSRKKGRIKRKIRRKLIAKNKIID